MAAAFELRSGEVSEAFRQAHSMLETTGVAYDSHDNETTNLKILPG